MEKNEPKGREKIDIDITFFIELVLLITGFISFYSSLLWTLTSNDKWFSRMSLSMVCFGFYAILKRLSKMNNKQ